jgi:peptidylprolyl isomerase
MLTAVIVASGIIAALATTGCRGGGANPDENDLVIPFVEPTPSQRTCLNDIYPAEAPRFDEVSEADYRPSANGVDYVVMEEGDGETPDMGWQVNVHYTGWLEDGCVFGTTYNSEREARFFIAAVIPGWRQSLLDMKVGERRRVRIPPDLGYGQAGSPPRIPANATLYFDVSLLGGITREEAFATATAVSEAAAATVTAISEEVEATFTAIAEEATAEAEAE